MKKFFGFLLVFLLFMCAIAVALILMPPTSWAKYGVIRGVKQTSGLDIKINGRLALSLAPSLHLRMEDVVLSNPAAPADKPVMTARAVVIRSPSAWRLLFQEDHRVEHVALTEPRIVAEIGKDGRASWEVPAPARSRDGAAAPARSPFMIQTLETTGADISFLDHRTTIAAKLDGAKILAREVTPDRFTEAILDAASISYAEPATGTVELGATSAKLAEFAAWKVRELTGSGATLRWRQPGQATAISLAAEKFTVKADTVGLDGTGPLEVSGGSVRWRDPAGGASYTASEFAGKARTFKPGRAEDVTLRSAALAISGATRAAKPASAATGPTMLDQLSFATPVLSYTTPLEGAVGLVWNKERVTGKVKLPSPEALMASASIPANLALTAAGGNLDFDGTIATDSGTAKGRTKVTTKSLDGIARWLGVPLPAHIRGNASLAGEIEATLSRLTMTNGRIEHAGNAAAGALTVDIGGERPRVSGKLASDKFNADTYVGPVPAKRVPPGQTLKITPQVPVNDALKAQLKGMLDAQPRRGGGFEPTDVDLNQLSRSRAGAKPDANGFEWSNEKFDLSILRTVDLDLDLSIKDLRVRGFQVNVPRLKTELKGGALALEGNDLATRGAQVSGKVSGKAQIDARQAVPLITTTFKADGIDVEEVSDALGITPMLGGITSLEGNLTSSGRSQKELVEGLSGKLRSQMGQGHVIGYDFSSVLAWIFGDREYNPERRTPITRLTANLNFNKGVARESHVDLDGPILGANAEGSMRLVDQEIDYRAKLRLSSWFRAISLRIFGDWSQPSVSPDLGSVFSRAGPGGDGALADALAGVDVKDPELASLIGQVLQRSGQRGLDPLVGGALKSLQDRIEKSR